MHALFIVCPLSLFPLDLSLCDVIIVVALWFHALDVQLPVVISVGTLEINTRIFHL